MSDDYAGELVPFDSPTTAVAVAAAPLREQIRNAWLLAQRSTHTRAAYGRDIADFFAWCDEFGMDWLTMRRVHLDAYRTFLESGAAGRTYSPSTVKRKLTTLSSFYGYCCDEEIIESNPMTRVKRPEVDDTSTTAALDLPQALRLYTVADEAGGLDAAMVRLLLGLGLRVSELCDADVSDMRTDGARRTLRVTRKGGKRQRLPIPALAVVALDAYLDGRRTGPLLLDRRGRRVTRGVVTYRLGKLTKLAGIPGVVTPHCLRHTAATLLLLDGVPLREVQILLGHSSTDTTTRYDRAADNLDRSAVYSLEALLDG